MTKRYNKIPGFVLTAVCAAVALATAPASAVPITMTYLQQAGFDSTSGTMGGDGPLGAPVSGQGGLAFFTQVPDYNLPPLKPAPANTWKGVFWGCNVSTAACANPADGSATGFPDLRDPTLGFSGFYVESIPSNATGTLNPNFQDITTITHYNRRISGNFLEGVHIDLFLRLGPNLDVLNGPNPRVIDVDFNETINNVGNPAACAANAANQPQTGTGAPINPLGSDCDDYALVAGANLGSVHLPANSPFGNTVPADIDFRLNAAINSGALVCNGVPGQQVGDCGNYVADPVNPKVIVYTAEGSTNTLTIQARIRGDVPDDRPVPLFVIGDVEPHAVGNTVNFWGAQWWKNNQMSGFVSNGVASFKGYANRADDFCGGTWQSRPGNSSNPPDVIPSRIAIIVTDTVLKQGPNISGTIKQIVLVDQDGGYGPAPGHRGNGPVVRVVCSL